MQKNSYRYEQTAARLVVEGYPDLSASQAADAIGILSTWKLLLVTDLTRRLAAIGSLVVVICGKITGAEPNEAVSGIVCQFWLT